MLWNHKFPHIFNNREGPLQKKIVYTAYENTTNCFSVRIRVSAGLSRDGVNLLSSKYSLVSCSAFKGTIFFNMKSLMDTGTSQISVKFSL